MKRKKLRNQRPEAFWGAVIGAGASLISELLSAKSASDTADSTAKSIEQLSAANAQALQQQNINNNKLQEESLAFMASENEKNRQQQRDMQMNLQLQGGALDTQERRRDSRIQVANGVRMKSRKKLRDAYLPLWGSYTDITTPDGGFNLPIGYSPEGYPEFRVTGRKHYQKHKVGNKLLGGVGEKVPGHKTIEAEDGEILIDRRMSPHGDVVIASNRKRGNVYPARMIEAGYPVDPIIEEQEIANRRDTSPVGKNRHSLKCGGRCKAINGTLLGGWISGGGNLLSSIAAGVGSYISNNKLAKAYMPGAQALINGYDNLKTIDLSGLNRSKFNRYASIMPVVRSSEYRVNNMLERNRRQQRLATDAVNNNSLSSSARLSRMSGINASAASEAARIYEDKFNKQEAIKQASLRDINAAATENARLAIENSKDFSSKYLDLLKYNNDIVNEGVLGKSQAMADALMGAAQAKSAGIQGLLGNIGIGIQGLGTNVGKAYAQNYKQQQELDQVLFGMPMENQVQWTSRRGTDNDKAELIADLEIQKDNATDATQIKQIQMWIDMLKRGKQNKSNYTDWDLAQDALDNARRTFRTPL